MITLSKIANLAHVSVSTVSKAFSMSDEVHEDTRKLIFDIAKQHGCFKKYYKAKYPKHIIAVICHEFKSSFYTNALSAIQETLSEYNCEICAAATEFSLKSEAELIEYYSQYAKVDGIITMGKNDNDYSDIEIPLATLNETNALISLTKEYLTAFKEIVEYFKNNRIYNIGYIGETHTEYKSELLKKVLKEFDIQLNNNHFITVHERFEAGGYSAMQKLFEKGSLPRAIICAYDHFALGAMRCIHDKGLKIPEDIAIVGINNIPEGQYITPSLTSINPEFDQGCRLIAEALIKHILGMEHETRIISKPKIVYRESTKI